VGEKAGSHIEAVEECSAKALAGSYHHELRGRRFPFFLGLADFSENHAIFKPNQNCTWKKPCFVLVSNQIKSQSPNSKKAIIYIISFLVNFFLYY
jgi:hypothetical protein